MPAPRLGLESPRTFSTPDGYCAADLQRGVYHDLTSHADPDARPVRGEHGSNARGQGAVPREPDARPGNGRGPTRAQRVVTGGKPVVSLARCLLALSALGATGLAGQRNSSDEWRPRTVPLYGVSYSPEVGLLVGAGLMHTRYAFRALPPSTRLTAAAAYATGARTYRVNFAGEFRRPLAPATVAVDLYASGLEILRFYGLGNASVASGLDSVYQVRRAGAAPRSLPWSRCRSRRGSGSPRDSW